MHRLKKPLWFVEAPASGGEGVDAGGDGGAGGTGSQSFTQADVDKLVGQARIDERRKATSKYADYDDLKAKAEGAKTIEDRMAEVEKRATESAQRALRAEIANAHGISAEDRDLFLTGTDEASLTAQAKRLAEREAERKKQGPRVRNEGKTPTPSNDDPMRGLVQQLFGND